MLDWIEELTLRNWDFHGYIVRQQLMDTRGWTEEMIDQFLQPDLIEANPHNNAQRMRLYLLKKVYATEKTEAFRNLFIERKWTKLTPLQKIQVQKSLKKIERAKIREENWRQCNKRKRLELSHNADKALEELGL